MSDYYVSGMPLKYFIYIIPFEPYATLGGIYYLIYILQKTRLRLGDLSVLAPVR